MRQRRNRRGTFASGRGARADERGAGPQGRARDRRRVQREPVVGTGGARLPRGALGHAYLRARGHARARSYGAKAARRDRRIREGPLRRARHDRSAVAPRRGGLRRRGGELRGCAGCRARARCEARAGRHRARQRLARDGSRARRRRARSAKRGGLAMLMELSEYLTRYYSGFNVFSYLTMRAILSALTALVLSLAFGPYLIQRLSRQ